jgi:endonuclease/exonuclease/phosphatase family metal-dependent hydrolase
MDRHYPVAAVGKRRMTTSLAGHAGHMRLATFNILHGRSPVDDEVDLDRYAKAIHELDADVLALQEVDRNQKRSEGADFTMLAAEAMGADEHRFVAALHGSPGTWIAATGDEQPDAAAYGIALLSRYPVHSWQVIQLPHAPTPVPMMFKGNRKPTWVRDEPRVAVAAEVETPHGMMTIGNTHLSFIRWWSGRQLRRVVRSLEQANRPLLLAGDFNMKPRRAASITGMHSMARHLTFPADQPREQIDHILLSGAVNGRTRSDVLRLPLSDHRALILDIS